MKNEKQKAIAAQVAKISNADRAALVKRMPVLTIAGRLVCKVRRAAYILRQGKAGEAVTYGAQASE